MAIATPGTTFVVILRDAVRIPATPPKKATNKSSKVGCVLLRISFTAFVGVILKNKSCSQ